MTGANSEANTRCSIHQLISQNRSHTDILSITSVAS